MKRLKLPLKRYFRFLARYAGLRLALAIVLCASLHAAVTINFFAGQLLEADGTTPVPQGALIQVIASTSDTVFTNPTAGSFVGSSTDDVVVASFSLNGNAGAGTVTQVIQLTLGGNLAAGDELLLRWWPTLTTSSTAPSAGDSYGQFRTDSVVDGSTIAWVVPPDSISPYTLNFATASEGGSQANIEGVASQLVIPEPSAWVLCASGLAWFGLVRRRTR